MLNLMNKNLTHSLLVFAVLHTTTLLGSQVTGTLIQPIAITVGDDESYVEDAKVWLEYACLDDPTGSYDPEFISAAKGPFKTNKLGSAFIYYKSGFCRSLSEEAFTVSVRGTLHIESPFHETFCQPLAEVLKMKEIDRGKNSFPGCFIKLKRKYFGKLPDVDLNADFDPPFPYIKRLKRIWLKNVEFQETPALPAIDHILMLIKLADPDLSKEEKDRIEREPTLQKPDPRLKYVKNLPSLTLRLSSRNGMDALNMLDRVLTLAGVTYEITDSEVVVKTKDGVVLNKDRWVKDKKKSEKK
jgi:hypothetical protein